MSSQDHKQFRFSGAYFKLEQEASVQQHREKLVKEGKLKTGDPGDQTQSPTLDDSANRYEILAEISAQQVRLNDPHASQKRRISERRNAKPGPEPISQEEMQRYRTLAYSSSIAGIVPRVSLSGRNRYNIPSSADTSALRTSAAGGTPAVMTLSPEAMEVAHRSYVAGVRALAYGSLLGIAVLAVGGTWAWNGIETSGGVGGLKAAMVPLADGLKTRVEPIKERIQGWVASFNSGADSDGTIGNSLQSRLKDRYSPQRATSSSPSPSL